MAVPAVQGRQLHCGALLEEHFLVSMLRFCHVDELGESQTLSSDSGLPFLKRYHQTW